MNNCVIVNGKKRCTSFGEGDGCYHCYSSVVDVEGFCEYFVDYECTNKAVIAGARRLDDE